MGTLVTDPAPTYEATVAIRVPGGDTLPLPITFRYRDRDSVIAWLATQQIKDEATLVLEAATAWGLDAPLTRESVEALARNYLGSGRRVIETYLETLRERRRTNLEDAARALLERGPDPAELAMFGLQPEDLDDAPVAVYPDNERAVAAFAAMATQWNVGPCGPTGLHYQALPFVFRMQRIPAALWADTFYCVRILEAAALHQMSRKGKQ